MTSKIKMNYKNFFLEEKCIIKIIMLYIYIYNLSITPYNLFFCLSLFILLYIFFLLKFFMSLFYKILYKNDLCEYISLIKTSFVSINITRHLISCPYAVLLYLN